MPLQTSTTSIIALIAALTFGSGCAAEEEITDAANKKEAGLLQDQLDAVVEGGARGAILFVDDPNSDPIELSAGHSGVQAEASMEEVTSTLEETEGLVSHGEETCGDWDGHDGSVHGYLSLARLMESGRRVGLLVDSAEQPEAQAAVADLMDSALCR
jgi:hypothetical protein